MTLAQRIARTLLELGTATQRDIVERLGATDSSVRLSMQRMLDRGEIKEVGKGPSRTGRRVLSTLWALSVRFDEVLVSSGGRASQTLPAPPPIDTEEPTVRLRTLARIAGRELHWIVLACRHLDITTMSVPSMPGTRGIDAVVTRDDGRRVLAEAHRCRECDSMQPGDPLEAEVYRRAAELREKRLVATPEDRKGEALIPVYSAASARFGQRTFVPAARLG
jgi:DNA-binding Lrp family transcriptional regulator